MFSGMRKRRRLTALLCVLAGTVAIAADHSAAGAWKLNAGLSTLKGCPSSLLSRGTLIVPPDIASASKNRRAAAGTQSVVSRSTISPDGRTLTLTPAGDSDCKLVYERQ
jgi:hypothetical protein